MPFVHSKQYPQKAPLDYMKGSIVRVESLKSSIDQTAGKGKSSMPVAAFESVFEAELMRVTKSIALQQDRQEMSVKTFASDLNEKNSSYTIDHDPAALRAEAEYYVNSCLQLQHCKEDSAQDLRNIAACADEKLGTSCALKLPQALSTSPWLQASNMVILFSDLYSVIRSLEAKESEEHDSTWVAPLSFERSTTKYWIEEDKLLELLLAATTEAPLLVYGKSGLLVSKEGLSKKFDSDELWGELASPISSVYFDSPAFDLYKARIARKQGSQLLRARWYGTKKPSGDEPVFMELKTHHEPWTYEKSAKERVTILEKHVVALISLEKDPTWTWQTAETFVLAACPQLNGEVLEKAMNLLLTMRHLILKLGLRPCVRSSYLRVAFQSPKNNSLRLTMDRSIDVIDEATVTKSQWCLPNNESAVCQAKKRLPYPVFEIKLAGSEQPESIQTLVDKGVMIEAAKFSKYLTGAAAFNASQVGMLPFWANHPLFADLFGTHPVQTKLSEDKGLRQRPSRLANESKEWTEQEATSSTESNNLSASKKSFPSFSERTSLSSFLTSRSDRQRPSIAPKKAVRIEPKSYFANERTYIQWIGAALMLLTVSALLLTIPSNDKAWAVNAGLYLIVCSIFIITYALFVFYRRLWLLGTGKSYGYVDRIGPTILALSLLLGLSLLLYHTATLKRAGVGLAEKSGLCYRHKLTGLSRLEMEPSDLFADHDRGILLVATLSKIMSIPLLPADMIGTSSSDLFVDDKTIRELITVDGSDFEALTSVDGVVYAISESSDGKNSFLFVFAWVDVNKSLHLVAQLELGLKQAEGIAHIPDPDPNGPGLLLVAAENGVKSFVAPTVERNAFSGELDLQGNVNSTTYMAHEGAAHVFNRKLLGFGLEDGKIGALYYFENVLYILLDNDRVVRGWDLNSGEILSEWKLPQLAGDGLNRQWEGMSLHRMASAVGTRGSGGNTGELLLDLALDTPAQIWTFAVKEGNPGEIILPECAGASWSRDVQTNDFEEVAAFVNQ